jgi:5-methylcytosine-specific restriction protein A
VVERLRGRAGQAQRLRRLRRTDGLCERCAGIGRWSGNGLGRTTIATVVNHIVPLVHGGSDDDANTENLCTPCDLEVTAQQFGHAAPVEGRGVARSGRPTSVDHPWNRTRAGGA